MKQKVSVFITGFIQVFFVVINTYFTAKEIYVGVLVASFTISLVWSFNVKRVAFGSMTDRLLYAGGAASGAVTGLFSSAFILTILKQMF
jgi:hypothetical protein